MTQLDLIRYLAIGRPDTAPKPGQDAKHEILAQMLTNENDPEAKVYKENALKILGKSHKVQPGKRIRLTSDNYEIHVQTEQSTNGSTLLLIAITDTEFGVHHNVTTCYQEFVNLLHTHFPTTQWAEKKLKSSQKKALDTVLSSIHRKYNTSSILEANKKVDMAKGTMAENINLALNNTERIEQIDQKSQDMYESSKEFHKKSKQVKCRFIRQRIKLIGIIVLIVAIVLTIIILSVALRK
eukprot:UN04652